MSSPTGGPPPTPTPEELAENRGPYIRNVTIGVLILAYFFVGLRLIARKMMRLNLGLDDWFVLAASVFLAATAGLNFAMIEYGLGRQAITISMVELVEFLKLLVISQIIFVVGIALVKLSILLLYLRIFPSKKFKIAVYVLIGVVVSWCITITLLSIFQCKPIEKSYMPWIPGTCIDLVGAEYGSGLPDILTDFFILVLPVTQVLKLKTSKKNKLVVIFFFTIGAFATFASIIRLVVVFQVDHANGTWTGVDPLVWAVVEQSAAVVSSCLPTLRPLVVYIHKTTGITIWSRTEKDNTYNSSSQGWSSELNTLGGTSRKFHKLDEESGLSTTITGSMANDEEPLRHMPQQNRSNKLFVQVEHSIEQKTSERVSDDDGAGTMGRAL
ncbi:hypothetical protein F5Y16DRAFT_356053 [Xylariaceae sp. FL0255]|nr:hypothetical protein F5Y16DRAFT_356053 [Xylariaceae sp. FL0255]